MIKSFHARILLNDQNVTAVMIKDQFGASHKGGVLLWCKSW